MSKSAKQDAKQGPAETAETESAATDAAIEPETAIEPAAADPADDSAKPELDDVKAKFRAALDRKRQVHAEGQGKGGHESGKVSGAHGPAASRRNFRRKSG
jgi:hypothetical protein